MEVEAEGLVISLCTCKSYDAATKTVDTTAVCNFSNLIDRKVSDN